MFRITRKFIMDHRTERGAWTKAQMEAIDIVWPPISGWIDRAIDSFITDDQRQRFIDGAKESVMRRK